MSRKKKLAGTSAAAALAAAAVIAVIHAGAGAAEGLPPVVTQSVQGMQAQMQLAASPAKILQHNAFTVKLTDEEGQPVTGSKLNVVLSMPGMMCGEQQFVMKEVQPGIYRGDAVPLMAGVWEAAVTVRLDRGELTFSRKLKAER